MQVSKPDRGRESGPGGGSGSRRGVRSILSPSSCALHGQLESATVIELVQLQVSL